MNEENRADSKNPRVFVSYSWTNDDHVDWVVTISERLMSDGIDVILDQWCVKDGHDLNAFMEQMVSDPTVDRVIIFSDAKYASKADGRAGGVGTETQIISAEVYKSVDQTKFVPLVCERDENGTAYLPAFLKSRKYIDFSNPDNEHESYDELVRNIYERPIRQRPPLGKRPAHLFEEDQTPLRSAQRGQAFLNVCTTGKGNAIIAFDGFRDAFEEDLEEFRMVYSKDHEETWCDLIVANIQSAEPLVHVFIETIHTGSRCLAPDEFEPLLLEFLEKLHAFVERPSGNGTYYEISEDNYKHLCYELFVSALASLVKNRRFSTARALIEHQYVTNNPHRGLTNDSFLCFNNYPRSIQECGKKNRRISLSADLIYKRTPSKHLKFTDILQADVLLLLASRGSGWFPHCIVYGERTGTLELFLRAVSPKGFANLKQLLNLQTAAEFVELANSENIVNGIARGEMWHCDINWPRLVNLEQLAHIET